ncbi:DUF4124 domain-containing protein [Lysobacter sp. FW306-1B-D06B]|uniref:DUF4124 domain-containing protein n=1 Tax=Lysobacter sp. FW306-1B-D06B TaxID=3140250 RepID=UPI003140A75C
MRHGAWLACALWSASATAQTVYKCVDAGGKASYQSAPCDGRIHEAARWDAVPEPPPTAEQLRSRLLAREHDRAESEFLSRRAGTASARVARNGRATGGATPPSACAAARETREQTLERVGLKRTYDLLSRLDEQVRKACR